MQFFIRIGLISLFIFGPGISRGAANPPQFRIFFQTESIVIGTQISLGEIAKIVASDEKIGLTLRGLKISEAAPPGETREVTLSYVKKCIKESGYNLQQFQFSGPRILRITTMPTKIIDLLIEDKIVLPNRTDLIPEFARNFLFQHLTISGCLQPV